MFRRFFLFKIKNFKWTSTISDHFCLFLSRDYFLTFFSVNRSYKTLVKGWKQKLCGFVLINFYFFITSTNYVFSVNSLHAIHVSLWSFLMTMTIVFFFLVQKLKNIFNGSLSVFVCTYFWYPLRHNIIKKLIIFGSSYLSLISFFLQLTYKRWIDISYECAPIG